MLRMTKATDYSIVILAHFAQEESRTVRTARDIAGKTHLPLPMVTKTMKLLAQKRFLVSQRGVKGGYQLAHEPKDLSVADIISAIEGPITLTECGAERTTQCPVGDSCNVREPWQVINQAVLETLKGIHLGTMAAHLHLPSSKNREQTPLPVAISEHAISHERSKPNHE